MKRKFRPYASSSYWRKFQYNGPQVVVLAVVLTGFPLFSPRLFDFSRVFLQQNYRKCRRTEKIPTEKPSYWQFYTFVSTTPLYPVRRVQRLHRTIVVLETRSFRSIALMCVPSHFHANYFKRRYLESSTSCGTRQTEYVIWNLGPK